MVILIKEFGKMGQMSHITIAERNEFAKTHNIRFDQTHFVDGWLVIESFYEEETISPKANPTTFLDKVVIATEKQKAFLRDLNIEFAEDISKEHASALIEKAKGAK
jgi:hypothetical protein